LHGLYERGCTPIISTGRSYEGVNPLLKALGLDIPVICYNGAQIVGADKTIHKHWVLSDELSRYLLELSRRLGIHFHGFWQSRAVSETQGVATEYYLKSTGVATEMMDFDSWEKMELTKVILIGPWNRESQQWPELYQAEQSIKKDLGDRVYTAFSKPFYLEVINGDCSKGIALEYLMKEQGLQKQDLVAFGDGLNDLEMLQFASTSVAMENSHPELFQHCTHRTSDCDEDGVAAFIEKHYL
jgi:Cof subfamily protein (haloacid dehalogenase superfamily)